MRLRRRVRPRAGGRPAEWLAIVSTVVTGRVKRHYFATHGEALRFAARCCPAARRDAGVRCEVVRVVGAVRPAKGGGR